MENYKLIAVVGPMENNSFEYSVVQDTKRKYDEQLIKTDFTDLREYLTSVGCNAQFRIMVKESGIQRPILLIDSKMPEDKEIALKVQQTVQEKFELLVR